MTTTLAQNFTGISMQPTYEDEEDIPRTLSAGARGYVLKAAPVRHIRQAGRTAALGESWFSERAVIKYPKEGCPAYLCRRNAFPRNGAGRDALPLDPRQYVRWSCPVYRLGW
jgi:DNA-binding NarL/FixJ family response regulator